MSSSRDEQGRQKLSDRETDEQAKQVKPVGLGQSVEASPAQDNGKSDAGTWEAVLGRENMLNALKRVEKNKGAAGIDGMEVKELRSYLKAHWLEVRGILESGKYRPRPVRRVEIPKPDGGVRLLGIPTVQDRLIQQAIAQVLVPMFEGEFSPQSYGFRPGRNAHQAVQKSQEYIREGYDWVVDIDLEKFFDRVNHDMLMARVARVVKDKRVLKLIRSYLESGVMVNGVVMETEEGTPQGGIVSPLLANIYLHRFDEWWWEHYGGLSTKEKNARRRTKQGNGIMVRYADDFVILWNGDKAGAEKLREEVRQFLAEELHLELSLEKTHITHASEGFDFLGFHIKRYETTLRVKPSEKNIERFKHKIRQVTCHSRGVDNEEHKFIAINRVLRGWINYFRNVSAKSTAIDLDWWVNHRVVRWLMHKHKKHIRWVLERYKVREQNEHHDRDNLAVKDSKGNRHYIYKMSDLPIRPYTYPFHRQNPYLERNDTTMSEIEIPLLDEMWDGASSLRDWRDVRAEVLERDGYRCQQCGSQDNLDVHHRQARHQGGDASPENLVTLCERCHMQTDTIGRPPSQNKDGGRQQKQD